MDDDKLADALKSIGPSVDSPTPPQTEEEPVSPAPASPLPLESFLGYRQRVNSDDGYIGSAMLEWAKTLPDAERERLESDIDFFNSSWDRFEAARPPRPADPPPQEPPPSREYKVPEWRRQQIERESRQPREVIGPWSVIGGGGVMPLEGTEEKLAAKKFDREVGALRERVRGGDKDAEYELASKLFGDASKWKPSHGPEHG